MKQTQWPSRIYRVAVLFAACAALAGVSPARSAQGVACTGDCNGNGTVSVNELVMMVNIALGALDMSACAVADADGDGTIRIDELVQATRAALAECEASPDPVGAVALSRHYVEVTFDGAVGPTAEQPGRYSITAPNGSRLAVNDARIMDGDPTRVLLVTDAQEAVRYHLAAAVTNGGSAALVFDGNTTVEPDLLYAIALSNTTVLLTFNERLETTSAQNRLFYRISLPDLDIVSAALQADGVTVVLTTEPQENIEYLVKVTNVRRFGSGHLIDPVNNTATFFGFPAPDTVRPRLDAATSTGKTTVVLRFSEPLDAPDVPGAARADDPINFSITPPLAIVGTEINLFNTQIILTTEMQPAGIDYTVTVSSAVHDPVGNAIDPAHKTATFRYLQAPALQTAVSLSNTTVLLTFSERLDQATAETASFYTIAAPDLAVSAAVLQADQISVLLTTASQANTQYTVVVTNVRGRLGGAPIDPTRNTASFTGIPPFDNVAPRLLSAQATNSTMILLTFNEPLLSLANPLDNEAEDPSNYMLSPAVTVIGAKLNHTKTQVLLTTLPLAEGIPYTLTVSNVKDLAGNLIDPANQSASFIFLGQAGLDDNDLPRVVGAASTGNTGIIVQYSRPMGDSAINPGSYVVVQANVNPEVGFLTVTGAAFTGLDRTAVALTTLSQNEVTYNITAVNVQDLIGLPIAPKQIIAGVLLDPATASFPGTPPSCPPLHCTNGEPGLDGAGLCATDDDCTPMPPCTVGTCVGACTSPCTLHDNDGDGLTDNDEQRGWVVTIVLANGDTIERQVTADLGLADTDGDGLDDAVEKNLSTDPRQTDTDGDQLNDNEEFNVIYSDPTTQDSDGDGISDNLEVEFFKTNAIVDDSDGDGYSDAQELFEMNRDPRISDLPQFEIDVGSSHLQIDERFTFTDENGETRTETSNTATALGTSESRSRLSSRNWDFHFTGGIEDCQTDNACDQSKAPLGILWSIFSRLKLETGFDRLIQTDTEDAEEAQRAFEQSLEKGRELSNNRGSTRELQGARIDVDLTLRNRSDVAFTLENVEVAVQATDPQDPARLLPIGTLVPGSSLQTGDATAFNIGPGESRGPVVFTTTEVFPNLVEDLMRDARGLVFRVGNYDLTTGDGRNFAFGLQTVSERTVGVSIDFGDGNVRQFHAITAGVLNRDRGELRCAPGGDHPDAPCETDGDCGTSVPCEGGKIVGGFSEFGGTGKPPGIPLDFVLQDVLHMRKTAPPVLVAGPDGEADTTAEGDDVQVESAGTAGLDEDAVVVAPGRNGILDTDPAGDDINPEEPDGILPGTDGAVQSVAEGDDVQLVPVGTTGVPEEVVVINAGLDGVLDTEPRGDDVADVVTGYEVSKTCDGATPFAILAGVNGVAETLAEDGVCTVALPPHFVGEQCSTDVDCGDTFQNAPSDTVATDATAGEQQLTLDDASAFPGVGTIIVGEEQYRYGSKNGNTLELATALVADVAAGTQVTLVTPRCDADTQAIARGTSNLDRDAVVIEPDTASFLVSVPSGDDVPVGPGIPCTEDDDCAVMGQAGGACAGPQVVVRVDNRRRGQYRRFWALILPDRSQYQTDFGRIQVRAGERIALAFIQDVDRDGLSAEEEFLRGSSDFRKDTDDDQIGDFSEVRLGWTVGVVGQPLRRVFSDPRRLDSDLDGLNDREEQDFRPLQCACDAEGPKSLLGSGNLLRGEDPMDETGGMPCRNDDDCPGTACRDAVHCSAENYDASECPPCGADVTLTRTDPGRRDTDGDGVADFDEVFGYLTGAGIVDPASPSGEGVIIAGPDRTANTEACPDNHCVETDRHCTTDGDCPSRQCIHPVACDEVQVVAPETGARDRRTVVVAAGPLGGLTSSPEGDDEVEDSSDGVAASHARGDDDLVVGIGQAVMNGSDQCVDGSRFDAMNRPERFAMCRVIMPGFDGTIASLPGGDDVIVPGGSGQKRESSDPLNPDTDMDGLADGLERVRGSSPNDPGDTEVTGDSDQDGLTDNVEDSGWAVTWTDENGTHMLNGLASNPFVPDTDFDGLPDYAERHMPCHRRPTCDGMACSNDAGVSCTNDDDCVPECPTDPTRADTDRDGLSDFDELSAEQFSFLARFNDFFTGYFVDGADSKRYGTDPLSNDTDDDGLSDEFELFVGWGVVRTDGTVTQVLSDPTKRDTDSDNLDDADERARLTDPLEPDTDSDGRTDGQEVLVSSNPLLPDVTVSVTYSYMDASGHFDGDGDRADWVWRFYAQHSRQAFPGDSLSDPSTGCGPTPGAFGQFIYFPGCRECQSNGFDFALNGHSTASRTYSVSPGESIVLNGWIVNENNCPGTGDRISDNNCRLAFVDTPLRYEDLQEKSFMTRSFLMSGGGCSVNVFVEIQVNCAGTGRRVCQFGSPCVFNADCTSDLCTNGRCAANCGNSIPEGSERCDDGNTNACGTCNSSCTGTGPGATCLVGTGCASDADCQSGSCFDGACVAVCGNGIQEGDETCDDRNASSCGTCDELCSGAGDGPTCPIGTTCKTGADCLRGACTGGLCVPVCGDGFVDPTINNEDVMVQGETCDDMNMSACGTCNTMCTGAGTGATCLGGVGCKTNADCASGVCASGMCTAVCGNGVVEPGETCDDNNTNGCGQCNVTCDGAGTGDDCPIGTGCISDDDCSSNNCNNGQCGF